MKIGRRQRTPGRESSGAGPDVEQLPHDAAKDFSDGTFQI
jgi:hypothetical protein